MKKDVKIKITGIQTMQDMQDEPETIELETTGIYYQKDGMHFLKYDEFFEGIAEPAKNLLKFDDLTFQMTKKGPVNTVMSFERNKSCTAHYMTPHGPLFLEIVTEEYAMNKQNDAIYVNIDYSIDYNYDYLTKCNLTIDVDLK